MKQIRNTCKSCGMVGKGRICDLTSRIVYCEPCFILHTGRLQKIGYWTGSIVPPENMRSLRMLEYLYLRTYHPDVPFYYRYDVFHKPIDLTRP